MKTTIERIKDRLIVVFFGCVAIFFIAVLIGLLCAFLKVGSGALLITLYMIAMTSALVGVISGMVVSLYDWRIRKTKASTK